MRSARLLAASVALVSLGSGCLPHFVRSDAARSPTATPGSVSVGEALGTGAADGGDPSGTDDPMRLGILRLTLVNPDGHAPDGASVRIRGPEDEDTATDAEGRVDFRGPPGEYTIQVPLGCSETVQILAARSGRFGLVAGRTATGRIEVPWRHRFAPAPPIYSSVGPYWPVGEEVAVRFRLADRCGTNEPPAPNRPFPTWGFETNDRVELTREPRLRSDADGRAFVHVSCTDPGPAELVAVDAGNPSDRLDLVAADSGLGGSPSCGND